LALLHVPEQRCLEGVVSKRRRDAPYRSGEFRDWRKVRRQCGEKQAGSGGAGLINWMGAYMPRLRQLILRMAACCAALLLTMTTQRTFATAGEDYAQQKQQDFSTTACSTLIQKSSSHLETARPAHERALQASPQAITQAATVPDGARATTEWSVGASPPANSSAQATGGSCEAYKSRHANGSTVWCSVRPAKGRVCPLGLGFSAWTCRNGIWVPVANQGETSK